MCLHEFVRLFPRESTRFDNKTVNLKLKLCYLKFFEAAYCQKLSVIFLVSE